MTRIAIAMVFAAAGTTALGEEPALKDEKAKNSYAVGVDIGSQPASGPRPLRGIDVSYKLDPRLTRGLYMGDRWVSPAIFRINPPGRRATVELRVEGVEAGGKRRAIRARWSAADPAMTSVTPAEGDEVRIVVQDAGECRLQVTAEGVSRDIFVRAAEEGAAIQVEVAQIALPGTPGGDERARLLAAAEEQSYAFGMDVGRRLDERPAEVDVDRLIGAVEVKLEAGFVALGVRHGLARLQGLLTEKELQSALVALQMRSLERERDRLAEHNRQAGEAYLARNALDEGVVALPSGLQYKVLRAGDGPRPAPLDSVLCHYRGTFVDGTEFDSTLGRGQPAVLPLRKVIRGLREALRLMPVGSKWQLVIPSSLAYGARGARGKIGPNATLVFDLEFIGIRQHARSARDEGDASHAKSAGVESAAAAPP